MTAIINILIIIFCCVLSDNIFADTTVPYRNPFLPANNITEMPSAKIKNQFPLQSAWIPVYFSNADNIMGFLSDKSLMLLSPVGKMHYDKRTNQLWIQDDAKHIAQIRSLISHLDQDGPQFLIKARIVTLDQNYQKELGVLFSTQSQTANLTPSFNMNLPQNPSSAGQFTIAIAQFSQNNLLNMQISALEQEGHASLISSPSLMTLNKEPAVIESGAEVPYQEATSSGATSASFKKAVLRLQVTPEYLPNHRVLLKIALNQDRVSALTVKGVPAIQTQQITTEVVLKNNQTIVLGGILESEDAIQKTGLPGLGKLPIIGGLLSEHSHKVTQQELLIFITPSMVNVL